MKEKNGWMSRWMDWFVSRMIYKIDLLIRVICFWLGLCQLCCMCFIHLKESSLMSNLLVNRTTLVMFVCSLWGQINRKIWKDYNVHDLFFFQFRLWDHDTGKDLWYTKHSCITLHLNMLIYERHETKCHDIDNDQHAYMFKSIILSDDVS